MINPMSTVYTLFKKKKKPSTEDLFRGFPGAAVNHGMWMHEIDLSWNACEVSCRVRARESPYQRRLHPRTSGRSIHPKIVWYAMTIDADRPAVGSPALPAGRLSENNICELEIQYNA
jgi:hypothetical protein